MTNLERELKELEDFVEREAKLFKTRMEPRLNSLTRNSFENSLLSAKDTVLSGARELVRKHNEHVTDMKSRYEDMDDEVMKVMESTAMTGVMSGLKAHKSLIENFVRNTEAMPFHR